MQPFCDYFSQHLDLSAVDGSPWLIACAIVQTLIGVVYLLWGWRIFNFVVMLEAALLGAVFGSIAGAALVGHVLAIPVCAVGGAVLFAVVAKVLVRFIFSLQAGLCAAGLLILGCEAIKLHVNEVVLLLSALIVLIVVAIQVYRHFAVAVMAVMSLQGAVFAVAGMAMLVAAALHSSHAVRPISALVAVVVLAVPSFLYQRSRGQVLGVKPTGQPAARRKPAGRSSARSRRLAA